MSTQRVHECLAARWVAEFTEGQESENGRPFESPLVLVRRMALGDPYPSILPLSACDSRVLLAEIPELERAVQVNILIMRVFVQLRELMATHKELAQKLDENRALLPVRNTRYDDYAPRGKVRGQADIDLKPPISGFSRVCTAMV